MTIRKITIDNSVKHIPQSEQIRERDCKPNTIKNISLLRKQNKKVSQNLKKFISKISAEGFKITKRCITNCYF